MNLRWKFITSVILAVSKYWPEWNIYRMGDIYHNFYFSRWCLHQVKMHIKSHKNHTARYGPNIGFVFTKPSHVIVSLDMAVKGKQSFHVVVSRNFLPYWCIKPFLDIVGRNISVQSISSMMTRASYPGESLGKKNGTWTNRLSEEQRWEYADWS